MRSAATSRGRTEAEVLSARYRTQHFDVDCWLLLHVTAVLSLFLHFSHKCHMCIQIVARRWRLVGT